MPFLFEKSSTHFISDGDAASNTTVHLRENEQLAVVSCAGSGQLTVSVRQGSGEPGGAPRDVVTDAIVFDSAAFFYVEEGKIINIDHAFEPCSGADLTCVGSPALQLRLAPDSRPPSPLFFSCPAPATSSVSPAATGCTWPCGTSSASTRPSEWSTRRPERCCR
jgi:hypothetical protein